MVNKDYSNVAKYYLYRVNDRFIKLVESSNAAKRFVQTLADLTGQNIFLYYVNFYDEVYFVREIKSCQKFKSLKK